MEIDRLLKPKAFPKIESPILEIPKKRKIIRIYGTIKNSANYQKNTFSR